MKRRIFSVDDLSDGEISRLFYVARDISSLKEHSHHLNNKVLLTVFFESSTRTRLSFEMAAHRLGLKTLAFHAHSSSMNKGENEEETMRNLLALKPDIVVIRQSSKLDVSLFDRVNAAIINGGDGVNEHPTQALLDCFTLLDYFRADDLIGKNIAIVGDIFHSRVAHSNIKLMVRLGAKVTLIAPRQFGLSYSLGQHEELSSFDELEHGIDAVMCLRIQHERIKLSCDIREQEFSKMYGLTIERLEKLGNQCVVLHPGPMNLGVEIEANVANHARSLITQQVTNGVILRASLLNYCLS